MARCNDDRTSGGQHRTPLQQQRHRLRISPARPRKTAPRSLPHPSLRDRDHIIAQLAKLGELRTAGVLTDAEFETEKAKLLAQ